MKTTKNRVLIGVATVVSLANLASLEGCAASPRDRAAQPSAPYFVEGNPACLLRHDELVWFPGQSYLFEEVTAYGRICDDRDLAEMLRLFEAYDRSKGNTNDR